MAQRHNLGELTEDAFVIKEITWKIPGVLSLSRRADYEVRSQEFSFAGGTWVLSMFINLRIIQDSIQYICICIQRLQPRDVELEVNGSFFLKTSKGKEFEPVRRCPNFTSTDNVCVVKYLERSKLVRMQNLLAPGGTLTVVCQMRTKSTVAVVVTPQKIVARPGTTRETLGVASEDCLEKRIEVCTQTEGDSARETLGVTSEDCRKKRIEVCTQTEGEFGTGSEESKAATPSNKFASDYKELLLSGDGCDVTLLVKGQQFEAHQTILRARSSVFAAMLKHNMKEKNTGLIDIADCDPEYFPDFLRFLYCGSVDSITSQNACSLYRAADKYDVQDLKSECLKFIKNNLDVDNFCDVISLALQHTETGLLKQATDFFAENMLQVVVTVKWQVFLRENTTEGNELIIKAANKFASP